MAGIAQVRQPLGRSLLAVSYRCGFSDVFLVDPDSGDARNFTAGYPSWAPDAQHVAFVSDRDGAKNLYLMQADGTGVRQLTRHEEPVVTGMQSWTPDGSRAPWKPA